MKRTPSQQTAGSSPVVNTAAWLFILLVTVPMGCGVLFLGAFWVIVLASQIPGWLANGLVLLGGLFVGAVLLRHKGPRAPRALTDLRDLR